MATPPFDGYLSGKPMPMLIADSFSPTRRPVLFGNGGAVSAAHPLAVAAGQECG